jgi:mono/diheme cytochrome c family protein
LVRLLLLPVFAAAAVPWATGDRARIAQGAEVYRIGCLQCHGADGRGNPEWESAVRPMDFSDCAGATAEPAEQWETVVRRGGPARGLSSVMPAFGEAFTAEETRAVVAYLRTFCRGADAYPPGDLNFRRLLATGKAFPETEVVLAASHRPAHASRETELEVVYESRLGPRFQYELALPLRAQGAAGRGFGDVELEGKQVLHFDLARLEIFSAGLGASLPTGSERKDLGEGKPSLSPFAAYGKGWGRTLFQAEAGARFRLAREARTELVYAAALSRALGPPRIAWTPAVEVSGSYDTRSRRHDAALHLEASKALNRLGHVIGSVGLQVPLRAGGQGYRLQGYLIWDFGDGPFWLGW